MNVLSWRPGRTGKGWVFPDGSVRAWAVNAREQPHHADVEHPVGSIRFRISPQGHIEMHGGDAWHASAARAAIGGTDGMGA
jgi:hypothetical protein